MAKLPPEPREIARPDRPLDPELEQLARWMDSVFHIPGLGIRFGLDAILGLLPGLGDLATSVVSLYILGAASRYGVPRVTLLRMALNIMVDVALGSLPFVGDAFDVFWKANDKNVALLKRHVQSTPAQERRGRRSDWLFVALLCVIVLSLVAGSVALVVLAIDAIRRAIM
jgi:hypothetical protein